MQCRVAILSVHGSPLARPGTDEAGGMQLYIRALSRALGRQGVEVDVFTRRVDPDAPLVVPLGERARVIHLEAGFAGAIDKNAVFDHLPEFVCNLKRFAQDERLTYDLLHAHYWLSAWVANRLAPRWNIPQVTMFHTLGRLKNRALQNGSEGRLRLDIEQRAVAAADQIIASSEHEREALVELYGARRDRVSVIPCGVDLELFQPIPKAEARAQLGLTGEVLLFVGRMDPIKGLDLLLQAMVELRHRRDLTLVVVGGGGKEKEYLRNQALAKRLGIADRVQFRGAIPQELLPAYYSAASVCVIPSHYESFGLAAIEAMACGTPVIGSKVGGLTAVIRDDLNGFLIPWRRPELFAERIEAILDDPALRQRVSRNARPSVLQYSWDGVAEQVLEVYRSVTRAHGHSLFHSEVV